MSCSRWRRTIWRSLSSQVEEIEGNDEEEAYVAVEDEKVLDAVYAIFKERFKDEFEFED